MITTLDGYPGDAVQLVADALLSRIKGVNERYDTTHMIDEDSNAIPVKVVDAGAANTVGALPDVPTNLVPPDRGEKIPFRVVPPTGATMLVIDAMPGPPLPKTTVPDWVAANSPPSGDIASARTCPPTARDVAPHVWPSFTT